MSLAAAAMRMEKMSWFPGHMYTASNALRESLRDVDLYVEVRDARLPYSTLNVGRLA
jgi:ribosome biogenesis GTPase A